MPKILSEPTLDALFDSPVRVRLLKLFLYSSEAGFDARNISRKLKIPPRLIKRQLMKLGEIGFIKSRLIKRKRIFFANQSFDFFEPLKALVTKASPAAKDKMLKRIQGLGRVRLAVIGGIFINSENSRADLMIVGDNVRNSKLNRFLQDLEAEVGKELDYAVMTVKEFNYRYGMYDRFVRDMLEFKHEKLINKLRI